MTQDATPSRIPTLAVTLGDVAGIGPEITAKMLLGHDELRQRARLLVVGDAAVLAQAVQAVGGDPARVRVIATPAEATNQPGSIEVIQAGPSLAHVPPVGWGGLAAPLAWVWAGGQAAGPVLVVVTSQHSAARQQAAALQQAGARTWAPTLAQLADDRNWAAWTAEVEAAEHGMPAVDALMLLAPEGRLAGLDADRAIRRQPRSRRLRRQRGQRRPVLQPAVPGRLGPGGYPDHRTGGGAGAVPAGRGGGQPWTSNGATCSSRCPTS
ncbi:YgbK domain protein [Bordetella pertussis 2371640]|nr:YgbK domain protein [Bordetella pertussis 2371640]